MLTSSWLMELMHFRNKTDIQWFLRLTIPTWQTRSLRYTLSDSMNLSPELVSFWKQDICRHAHKPWDAGHGSMMFRLTKRASGRAQPTLCYYPLHWWELRLVDFLYNPGRQAWEKGYGENLRRDHHLHLRCQSKCRVSRKIQDLMSRYVSSGDQILDTNGLFLPGRLVSSARRSSRMLLWGHGRSLGQDTCLWWLFIEHTKMSST